MTAATEPTYRPVFQALWCATDLGPHRPCGGTYEWYEPDALPPLDPARFDGGFGWLGGTGPVVPELAGHLDAVAAELAGAGMVLPADFTAFQAGADSHRALDAVSATACWTDVSSPIPSPVEPGAFLVRFLRDQQDCVHWYLYLRPTGEAFVVASPLDLAHAPEWDEPDGPVDWFGAIARCASSFEEFAYRFWVENRLWCALHGYGEESMDDELSGYLAHYERA
ncbi:MULTISPECIES: hypothetical protein [Kitasatospora]|uniref:SUKH-4 immunity protein of toxin-antitoxin system n=1 Tax=Kitasatospora cystarginea TaxID=58350 RepID=A0ABP5RVJ8_9ACTN